MARRKNTAEEKRTHCIMVRLNEFEYEMLSDRANKTRYPLAVYARMALIDGSVSVHYKIVTDIDELKTLTTEFGRIGNNLNQIAKYFNSGGLRSLAMEDEIHECIFQLFQLRKEVLRMAGEFHGSTKTYR